MAARPRTRLRRVRRSRARHPRSRAAARADRARARRPGRDPRRRLSGARADPSGHRGTLAQDRRRRALDRRASGREGGARRPEPEAPRRARRALGAHRERRQGPGHRPRPLEHRGDAVHRAARDRAPGQSPDRARCGRAARGRTHPAGAARASSSPSSRPRSRRRPARASRCCRGSPVPRPGSCCGPPGIRCSSRKRGSGASAKSCRSTCGSPGTSTCSC